MQGKGPSFRSVGQNDMQDLTASTHPGIPAIQWCTSSIDDPISNHCGPLYVPEAFSEVCVDIKPGKCFQSPSVPSLLL